MKVSWPRKNIIRSIVIKEFRQMLRDRRMRFILFGVPVVMLLLFGYAVNTDVSGIRMAVLDSDRSQASRLFLQRFTGSAYFIHNYSLDSPSEADRLLDRALIDVYLHIPLNFSSGISSGKGTAVQIIVDGTDSMRAAVIVSYINLISGDFSFERMKEKISVSVRARGAVGAVLNNPVELRERSLFNPELKSRNFYLPAIIGLLLTLVTTMLTSMSVVKERESGTMDQLIVSPLRPVEFVAGKTIPFALIGFVDIVVITIIAIAWFSVPFNGSFIMLIAASMFYVLCALSIGIYISTISATQQQAMLSTFLFFIPAILFSGFAFPVYSMPAFFRYVALLDPLMYFVRMIRGIFLKGSGVAELWPDTAVLAVMGIVLFALSIRRFSRGFE
ncbi:MAG TPA: ABC transporter permease [Spirochaetota bacterium]|jgi:ABC-2 type transport system permease protein|nr:ABC transporter permease [Spirochaetota bacterium]HQO40671.1 ABC transporter permease [Spirochaetota bacterium]